MITLLKDTPFEFRVEDLKGYKPYGPLSNIVEMDAFGRIIVGEKSFSNLPELMDEFPDQVVGEMIAAMNEHLQTEHDRENKYNRFNHEN